MASLNGTILWCHKIAPFFEAINLLLQNLWRHKLSLSCMKFHRYSLNTLNNYESEMHIFFDVCVITGCLILIVGVCTVIFYAAHNPITKPNN